MSEDMKHNAVSRLNTSHGRSKNPPTKRPSTRGEALVPKYDLDGLEKTAEIEEKIPIPDPNALSLKDKSNDFEVFTEILKLEPAGKENIKIEEKATKIDMSTKIVKSVTLCLQKESKIAKSSRVRKSNENIDTYMKKDSKKIADSLLAPIAKKDAKRTIEKIPTVPARQITNKDAQSSCRPKKSQVETKSVRNIEKLPAAAKNKVK